MKPVSKESGFNAYNYIRERVIHSAMTKTLLAVLVMPVCIAWNTLPARAASLGAVSGVTVNGDGAPLPGARVVVQRRIHRQPRCATAQNVEANRRIALLEQHAFHGAVERRCHLLKNGNQFRISNESSWVKLHGFPFF